MVTGIAFDLVGYVLMMIPYIFFWDYTDEKHVKIMEALKQRAGETSSEGTSADAEALPAEEAAVSAET